MSVQHDPNCPFCKIVSGEYPSKKVYEDDKVLCVLDINPATKGHMLILPKNHYPIMPVIPKHEFKHLARATIKISQASRSRMLNSQNKIFIANGGVAGQQVSHFLIHIIPSDHLNNFDVHKKENVDEEVYKALKSNLNIMMNNHFQREGVSANTVETQDMFETNIMLAKIPEKLTTKGHIQITAKKKLSMSEVEDFFYLASFASTASFEYLGAHGSNIMMDEYDGNMNAHIIPRFGDDGLNFMWTPNRVDGSELEKIKNAISFGTIGISFDDPVFHKNEKTNELQEPKDESENNEFDSIKPVSKSSSNFISNKIGKSSKKSIFLN